MIEPSDSPLSTRPAALTSAARRRQAILRGAMGTLPQQPHQTAAPSRDVTTRAESLPVTTTREPATSPRSRRTEARVILALASASLVFAIVAIVLSVRGDDETRDRPAETMVPQIVVEPSTAPARATVDDAPANAAQRGGASPSPEAIDSSNVVRALRRASFDFASDPEAALRRFQSAFAVIGETWIELDRAQRLAALELSVEFLLRASDSAEDARFGIAARSTAFAGVDALLARDALDPATVTRAVWSAGLATRLLRERGAESALLDAASARVGAIDVRDRLDATSASFEVGALSALRIAATKLAAVNAHDAPASREAWAAWDRATEIASASDPVAARDLALHAADAVLRGVSSRPGDTVSRDRLITLLARADWTSSGDARNALLRWLDDSTTYSTRELAIVTQWLASNSRESGLGVSDTLSSGASGYQRSDLRSRLGARWTGGQSVISASVLDRWASAATSRLESDPVDSSDPVELLRAASLDARLAGAAALLWRGEADAARAIVDDPANASSSGTSRQPRLDALSPRPDDGQFALRFLSANQNAQERIDLLRDLVGASRELGSIDAEVVFEQAMFGTPSEVRRIAQRIADLRSDDPAMINAALESLPRAPRTVAMNTVYEAVSASILPPVDDAGWPRATRAALVRRLLDILTGGAALDPADSLASTLGKSYADRAGAAPDTEESPSELASRAVAAILAEARAAGGIALEDEIASASRRFDARRALATGEMQRFAVESSNAAEALAMLVAIERPSVAESSLSIAQAMREAINEEGSAPAQILASERASLALWNLRLGGDR